ncbi:hypothetical protein TNIN_416921 [Trichonephila inaurata madagascariensis]|uniref:Uncharacterized protein n=1 Tax=Trichonephila inaurata madagascariensis TaxID=2747483 RepID=A0A8X7BRW2_9ARAC|nr:hypothetical protein TNIN_416921 [Trichonephila inaurata madagascariensis]
MTRSSSSWPRGVSLAPPRVTRMWASYPSRPPGRHLARFQHLFQKFHEPRSWNSVKRAGHFCCGRVEPRPLPSTYDSCSVLPDLETRQMDPFLIGVLVKGMSHDLISPGLSRMYISGVREIRTAFEGQQVADLQVVFLGQRCSPINGEQWLTGYFHEKYVSETGRSDNKIKFCYRGKIYIQL